MPNKPRYRQVQLQHQEMCAYGRQIIARFALQSEILVSSIATICGQKSRVNSTHPIGEKMIAFLVEGGFVERYEPTAWQHRVCIRLKPEWTPETALAAYKQRYARSLAAWDRDRNLRAAVRYTSDYQDIVGR